MYNKIIPIFKIYSGKLMDTSSLHGHVTFLGQPLPYSTAIWADEREDAQTLAVSLSIKNDLTKDLISDFAMVKVMSTTMDKILLGGKKTDKLMDMYNAILLNQLKIYNNPQGSATEIDSALPISSAVYLLDAYKSSKSE